MRISFVTLFAFCFSQLAGAADTLALKLKECQAISAKANKGVPMKVDRLTTLETTFCTPGKLKPVIAYRGLISVPKSEIPNLKNGLVAMKKQQVNSWCGDPEKLKIMQVADVKNIYYDINKNYVGELDVQLQDCQLLKR